MVSAESNRMSGQPSRAALMNGRENGESDVRSANVPADATGCA